MADVNIPGQGFHNMVFVATEHDSLYAFDANGRSSTPLWQVSFIDPANGVTTVPAADTGETADIPVEIGITSTPVIDPATNTIYVLAKTKEVSGGITAYVQRLHALDVRTGAEKFNGPVVITAHVPGNGPDAQNGQIFFNPLMNAQRSAVSLINGVIYLAFSSHGGIHPFHGWVIGYSAQNLQQQTMSFCATPNGDNGGVWMDGDGIATDSSGDLYFITGNGLFDADTGAATTRIRSFASALTGPSTTTSPRPCRRSSRPATWTSHRVAYCSCPTREGRIPTRW